MLTVDAFLSLHSLCPLPAVTCHTSDCLASPEVPLATAAPASFTRSPPLATWSLPAPILLIHTPSLNPYTLA